MAIIFLCIIWKLLYYQMLMLIWIDICRYHWTFAYDCFEFDQNFQASCRKPVYMWKEWETNVVRFFCRYIKVVIEIPHTESKRIYITLTFCALIWTAFSFNQSGEVPSERNIMWWGELSCLFISSIFPVHLKWGFLLSMHINQNTQLLLTQSKL